MALTDASVRQARSTGKDHTVADSDGLALLVRANGTKSWDFRFYWAGKQSRISLGTYPEVSFKEARQRWEEARALIARSIDPRVHRRQTRSSTMLASDYIRGGVSSLARLQSAKSEDRSAKHGCPSRRSQLFDICCPSRLRRSATCSPTAAHRRSASARTR